MARFVQGLFFGFKSSTKLIRSPGLTSDLGYAQPGEKKVPFGLSGHNKVLMRERGHSRKKADGPPRDQFTGLINDACQRSYKS
jgi:hypothetical protein